MTAETVKALLAKHGLRPNKALGQNFLVSPAAIEKIIAAMSPSPEDFIIEIGAGLGALTVPLALKAGRVAAVEIDKALGDVLEKELAAAGLNSAYVARGDFLRTDLKSVTGKTDKVIKICGSLPYYITTPLIRRIFSSGVNPALAALVMQKEAADKLVARPGEANYGVLALETAYHARVEAVCELPPSCFYPQPGVHSQAVLLEMLDDPPVKSCKDELFKVIRTAFSTRRKTLANCLSHGLGISRESAAQAVSRCGLPPGVRGERLSLTDYDNLTKILFDNA